MMPQCKACHELGESHEWTVRRFYGRCPDKQGCYIPDIKLGRPLNKQIAKILGSRGGKRSKETMTAEQRRHRARNAVHARKWRPVKVQ